MKLSHSSAKLTAGMKRMVNIYKAAEAFATDFREMEQERTRIN